MTWQELLDESERRLTTEGNKRRAAFLRARIQSIKWQIELGTAQPEDIPRELGRLYARLTDLKATRERLLLKERLWREINERLEMLRAMEEQWTITDGNASSTNCAGSATGSTKSGATETGSPAT